MFHKVLQVSPTRLSVGFLYKIPLGFSACGSKHNTVGVVVGVAGLRDKPPLTQLTYWGPGSGRQEQPVVVLARNEHQIRTPRTICSRKKKKFIEIEQRWHIQH